MTKQLEALIAEAKLSASIMELISSFEPQDIDGDDVDLRFEVDGFDTGCNVSLVEKCGKAAEQLAALIAALEQSQRANAAQDDHINQQQDRIEQLEKGRQEAAKHITSWRRLAKQNIAEREKDIAELDDVRISALENVAVLTELLALREAGKEPVNVPDHITYLREPVLANVLADDDNSPMANAARILAREVRFWRSKPLYAAPQPPVWFGVDWAAPQLPEVPDERAAFNAWNNEDNLPIAGVPAKNAAWLAWQARASIAAAPKPEV